MAIDASVQSPSQRRPTSHTIKGWARSVLIHMALIPAAMIFLLPFLWMLSTALKPDAQLFTYPPVWIPNPLQWANFPKAVN
jgi:multiple sugar transport system permease protein